MKTKKISKSIVSGLASSFALIGLLNLQACDLVLGDGNGGGYGGNQKPPEECPTNQTAESNCEKVPYDCPSVAIDSNALKAGAYYADCGPPVPPECQQAEYGSHTGSDAGCGTSGGPGSTTPTRIEDSGVLELSVSSSIHGGKIILAKILNPQPRCFGHEEYRVEFAQSKTPGGPAALSIVRAIFEYPHENQGVCAIPEIYALPRWEEIYVSDKATLDFPTIQFKMIDSKNKAHDCSLDTKTLVNSCKN